MSIFIEKLSLGKSNPDQIHLTITDFVLGDHGKGYYTYQDFPHDTSLIRDLILRELEKTNIFLGKHYGLSGISLNKLLDNNYSFEHNYYIEIPVGHIQFYKITDLVALSNKYKIILVDIEEGGTSLFNYLDYNNTLQLVDIRSFIKKSKLNVENIYYASPSFKQTGLCKEIKLHKIWILMQSLCVPFVQDIIQNNNKQKYLDILEKKQYEKFAVFRNWRARKWRVALLSVLYKNNMLDNIDWSLIGQYGHLTYDIKTIEFKKDYFLKYASQEWLDSSKFKGLIDDFFCNNESILPKFLLETDTTDKFSLMRINEDQIKKYRYSIDVDNATMMTEKPVKSFLQGSLPILIYTFPNGVETLRSFGFKLPDYDFNSLCSMEDTVLQAGNTIRCLYEKSTTPNLDDIVHNFELCVDKHTLASYLIQPLVNALK